MSISPFGGFNRRNNRRRFYVVAVCVTLFLSLLYMTRVNEPITVDLRSPTPLVALDRLSAYDDNVLSAEGTRNVTVFLKGSESLTTTVKVLYARSYDDKSISEIDLQLADASIEHAFRDAENLHKQAGGPEIGLRTWFESTKAGVNRFAFQKYWRDGDYQLGIAIRSSFSRTHPWYVVFVICPLKGRP